jgi:saccharopine dehydrogenase-like NADP-dependent oxidoreductase
MDRSESLTPRNFINAFLPYRFNCSVEDKFRDFLRKERVHLYDMFAWLGLFENVDPIGISNASPAQLLQHILEGKLVLNTTDKDMIVMHHEFEYTLNSRQYTLNASMVYKGEDQTYTAMANTVGLPMGIIAKRILKEQISLTGVQLPIQADIYLPVLEELKRFGIAFDEQIEPV